jgi:hypothetical protein
MAYLMMTVHPPVTFVQKNFLGRLFRHENEQDRPPKKSCISYFRSIIGCVVWESGMLQIMPKNQAV